MILGTSTLSMFLTAIGHHYDFELNPGCMGVRPYSILLITASMPSASIIKVEERFFLMRERNIAFLLCPILYLDLC